MRLPGCFFFSIFFFFLFLYYKKENLTNNLRQCYTCTQLSVQRRHKTTDNVTTGHVLKTKLLLDNGKLYVTCGMVPCLLTSTDR